MIEVLETARAEVMAEIAAQNVGAELIGDLTVPDLLELVEQIVSEKIKAHLSEEMTEEDAEEMTRAAMESAAIEVGLIMSRAILAEAAELLDRPELTATLPMDRGSDLITALLRDNAVTIRIQLES